MFTNRTSTATTRWNPAATGSSAGVKANLLWVPHKRTLDFDVARLAVPGVHLSVDEGNCVQRQITDVDGQPNLLPNHPV